MSAGNRTPGYDLCCFSYSAASEVLRLESYPPWDDGSPIISADSSFAGDGPLVAAMASGLGLRVALETNGVGDDERGRDIRAFLERSAVAHRLTTIASPTPRALILTHPDGAREWLAQLEQASTELASNDGELIRRAGLLYVDYFVSIADGAIRAIENATGARVPIFVNLGSSVIDDQLRAALTVAEVAVIQGSVAERESASAVERLSTLAQQSGAALTVVTVGALGALATKQGEEEVVAGAARQVEIDYTHGAGAAFSAGLIYALQQSWPLQRTLEFACALGSMQCTLERRESPTAEEVSQFIAAHQPGPTVSA